MADTPLEFDNWRLSHSSIERFRNCPRSWYYYYIEHRPDAVGIEALVGSFVHDVLEHVMKDTVPEERDLSMAKELTVENWPKFFDGVQESLGVDKDAERELKWKAWSALEGLWDLEDPSLVDVQETEMRLEISMDDFRFLGFVDRVDIVPSGLAIVDYKTGKIPKSAYVPSKMMQIMLYAAAYEEITGVTPSVGRLIYTKGAVFELAITPEVIDGAKKFLRRNAKRIKKAFDEGFEGFKPKVGPLCAWCAFVGDCEKGQKEFYRRDSINSVRLDAPAYEILGHKSWRHAEEEYYLA